MKRFTFICPHAGKKKSTVDLWFVDIKTIRALTSHSLKNRLFSINDINLYLFIIIIFFFKSKFELQSMLIHCDLTQARTDACDLPARTSVRIKILFYTDKNNLLCHSYTYFFILLFQAKKNVLKNIKSVFIMREK